MAEFPAAIAGFLAAISDRDVDTAGTFLTDDITYHFLVPHPPVSGRAAVLDALRSAIGQAGRVRWEVMSWLASAELAFVERIDRFWFDDREASIECTGVFVLRAGKIAEIRDYADLATWRSRKDAALNG